MATFDPRFGDCEGPLGFPMHSQAAKELDALIRSLPREDAYAYRKSTLPAALSDLKPGERADVSWITREDVDREGDLIRASGMDDSQFALNPIVTLNHAYGLPPVGLSLWRRAIHDSGQRGVIAKTFYPVRPDSWASESWPPDECLALVQSGLMRGKSIGFLPLKVRPPTDAEASGSRVRHVIEKWLLLEYACCYLPVQQHAVVEAVGKGLLPPLSASTQVALGIEPPAAAPVNLIDAIASMDWNAIATRCVRASLDRLRGRIV